MHVSRTLRRLRDEGLLAVEGGRWAALDAPRLREAGGFGPNYLHLDRARDDPSGPLARRLEGLA